MKQRILSLLFLALPAVCAAQVTADSLRGAMEAHLDTAETSIHLVPDSVRSAYLKVDSVRREFNASADSLQKRYHQAIADIDVRAYKLKHKIDSLQTLGLSTRKYEKSLRKLSGLKAKAESEFTEVLASIKSRTTGKLDALDVPPEYKEPLRKLTTRIRDVSLAGDMEIPTLKIPGYDIPGVIGNVSSVDGISGVADLPGLPNAPVPSGVGDLTERAQGYRDDIGKIATGDLTSPETLQETIESKASNVDGIEELQKQSGVIDGHKTTIKELADPDKGKEKAAGLAKKAAVNHFQGKEEQLKAAMEKISKYKQKYSSVSSIKDLPKRPPNAMKGKPFLERLVPGVYFQYQQKNFYLLDINPYAGYRISGRFTGGVGWNHRVAWDSKHKAWDRRSAIFGPRAFVDFKLGKGFIAHVEGESMNSFVPSTLRGNPDVGQREWVWSLMTGLKKEYRIYRNLKGTALIQYNLFNRYYKAPYVDRLNSRIGFEYVLKAKKPARKKQL